MGIGAEIFFFYGSILMSQWVSNLSTLPSRVPRRASRVPGSAFSFACHSRQSGYQEFSRKTVF